MDKIMSAVNKTQKMSIDELKKAFKSQSFTKYFFSVEPSKEEALMKKYNALVDNAIELYTVETIQDVETILYRRKGAYEGSEKTRPTPTECSFRDLAGQNKDRAMQALTLVKSAKIVEICEPVPDTLELVRERKKPEDYESTKFFKAIVLGSNANADFRYIYLNRTKFDLAMNEQDIKLVYDAEDRDRSEAEGSLIVEALKVYDLDYVIKKQNNLMDLLEVNKIIFPEHSYIKWVLTLANSSGKLPVTFNYSQSSLLKLREKKDELRLKIQLNHEKADLISGLEEQLKAVDEEIAGFNQKQKEEFTDLSADDKDGIAEDILYFLKDNLENASILEVFDKGNSRFHGTLADLIENWYKMSVTKIVPPKFIGTGVSSKYFSIPPNSLRAPVKLKSFEMPDKYGVTILVIGRGAAGKSTSLSKTNAQHDMGGLSKVDQGVFEQGKLEQIAYLLGKYYTIEKIELTTKVSYSAISFTNDELLNEVNLLATAAEMMPEAYNLPVPEGIDPEVFNKKKFHVRPEIILGAKELLEQEKAVIEDVLREVEPLLKKREKLEAAKKKELKDNYEAMGQRINREVSDAIAEQVRDYIDDFNKMELFPKCEEVLSGFVPKLQEKIQLF
ncbi:MAG: hypothetical protein JW791_01185 [Nanoarchaeota archaeon]|nr:hypothetical protein [Nanoarchaeota archaeon]